jgi:hypothetical protein
MTTGPVSIWFSTTNGAIQYCNNAWAFRKGGRWLLDNHVKEIVIDSERNAWFATSKGVSCISYQSMTLAKKATFYEKEIEKYHHRTQFGYVNPAKLSVPGDKSTTVATCTDHVYKTKAEKDRVRAAVRNTIDHIIDLGYNIVDYDGKSTRWGRLSSDDINRNPIETNTTIINRYDSR